MNSLNHPWLEVNNETTIVDAATKQESNDVSTSKRFPQFTDSGVVLFYHLAKTGGVTIEHFNKLDLVVAFDECSLASIPRMLQGCK